VKEESEENRNAPSSVPMGTIVAFALSVSSVPRRWLLCDGSPIPSQYQDLITALGSTYTPNLCARTIIGTGLAKNSPQSDGSVPNFPNSLKYTLDYTGGEYTHTLAVTEMPVHDHTLEYYTDGYVGTVGNLRAVIGTDRDSGLAGVNQGLPVHFAGGSQPHNTMQPFIAMNYIIFTGATG
jgi:microcystin-dependent protein